MSEASGRRVRSVALAPLLVGLLVVVSPGHSLAQSVSSFAQECADLALRPLCLEGALAVEAARGGVGLSISQGSPVPGSSSTVGLRIGSSPRIAVSARGAFTHARMPDPRTGQTPSGHHDFWGKTVEGSVAIGLFDGLSPLPTVGGLFSVDVLASISAVALSDASGFEHSLQGVGYGARIGILRESFTLPGVTFSAMRRHLNEAEWGTVADAVSFDFKPTVTSLRAVAGKDLFAFGVLGGWGWDRYSGHASMRVQKTIAGQIHSDSAASSFSSDRHLFFGGLSYTFLVLQLSGEAGWAEGWEDPPGRPAGGYDPTDGTFYGSVAARLTW